LQLDALKLDSVHVVGASMGGMLSQMLCIQHPKRVRSLTSIMSTTGDRWLPSPSAEALVALRSKRPDPRIDMSAYIEATLEVQRVMCGPGNKLDEEYARPFIRLNGERMFYPDGSTRQFAAIVTTPDRTAALRHINIPTAVIHGREDPLVPLEHGLATHASIPGSTMHIIDGMGHNMPSPSWIPIANIIAELAQRASGGRFHATATPSNVNVTLNEC
jgi:pimeloyl-ACP methyl ester carboxylesterase